MADEDHLSVQRRLDAELDSAHAGTLEGDVQTGLEQALWALTLVRGLGAPAS